MVISKDECDLATAGSKPSDVQAIGESDRELQRLSHYRSLMLANLAHDLRTPLTAILGFAEVLLDFEKLTESQKHCCEKIQNSGLELQRTIARLSDLARLDLDSAEVVLREFSLPGMLDTLCGAFARQVKKKDLSLSYEAAGLGVLVSDESKIRQSLYNFLAYAVARSPAGGRVHVTAGLTEGNQVVVRIDDEGGPIDVARGFDLSGISPTGEALTLHELGLDISRRLLAAVGGTVALENREPTGLSIVVILQPHHAVSAESDD